MSFNLLVDGIFEIKGRGIILAGNLPQEKVFLRPGQEVQIENPNGTIAYGVVTGIEHISRRKITPETPFGLLVRGITKDCVQPGARIKPLKVLDGCECKLVPARGTCKCEENCPCKEYCWGGGCI